MKLNRTHWYVLIFAAIGYMVAALITYVERGSFTGKEELIPYIRVGDRLKSMTLKGHLMLEELLSGDGSLKFDTDVMPQFVSAKNLLQDVYDGKENQYGKFGAITDEETRAVVKEAIIEAESVIAIMNDRWKKKEANAGLADSLRVDYGELAGGKMDQQFDKAFFQFQSSLEKLDAHLTAYEKDESAFINVLSWFSLVVLFGAVTVLTALLYWFLRHNDKIMAENAQRLAEETHRVENYTLFIEGVSSENYQVELKTTVENDPLAASLLLMRDKLKETSEADKRRSWSTTGQAQLGEILRDASGSASDMYDKVIRFIVKYTKSNQGGIFVLNDETEKASFLEMMSCYAYNRKKFIDRKINVGEGLVGQCFLEGERIYLLDVPNEYINITSGLGGATPRALLLIPMKVNDQVFGVLELASFEKFEDYEIEFIEKLSESVASALSNVKVNEQTKILLEKTRQQTEEMKSQEEEIRQNMEELEATQEEMRRKQQLLEDELSQSQQQQEILQQQEKVMKDSQDTLQAIVDNIPRAIFWKDKNLVFRGCNKIFSDVAGLASPKELIGHTDFDMPWKEHGEEYRTDDLQVMKSRKAKLDIEEVNVNSDGQESWVRTSKVPIVNQTGEVVAVLGMFEDITKQKKAEADMVQKLKEREEALTELERLRKLISSKS